MWPALPAAPRSAISSTFGAISAHFELQLEKQKMIGDEKTKNFDELIEHEEVLGEENEVKKEFLFLFFSQIFF